VRSRLTFANVASGVALFISLSGGAYAATSGIIGADRTIRACVAKSGTVRILRATQSCTKRETMVAWNQRGPVGKTGPVGAPGPRGERGQAGADGAPGLNGRDIDASNHYTKAESDAKYLAVKGKAADAERLDGAAGPNSPRPATCSSRVAANGSTVSGSRPSGVSASALGTDSSRVTFGEDVSACSFTAMEADGSPSGESIAVASAGGGNVDVVFQVTRRAFHLQVIC
jgi:hypothetical protein